MKNEDELLLIHSPKSQSRATSLNSNKSNIDLLYELFKIALPTCLFQFTFSLAFSINIIFINMTSLENKAAAINGMGAINLFISVSIQCIYSAQTAAFDVLGSNAYSLKKYRLLGIYLHKTIVSAYLMMIILVTIFYFFTSSFLVLLDLKAKELEYANEYLIIYLFCVPFDVQLLINSQYLNIIHETNINLAINFISILFHPFFAYVFIIYFDLGVSGAALSTTVCFFINSLQGFVYIYIIQPLPQSIFRISLKSLRNFWNFIRFTASNSLSIIAETWASEILTILAIWIGSDDYTIFLLLVNINQIIYAIIYGFGVSLTIAVSKRISLGKFEEIKRVKNIAFLIGTLILACYMLTCYFYSNSILRLYIDDDRIITKGGFIIFLGSISMLFECYQFFYSCTFRGLGENIIPFISMIINFYLVQFMLCTVFGKVLEYGVLGMVLSIIFGNFLTFTAYSILFCRVDFNKYFSLTMNRVNCDDISISVKSRFSSKEIQMQEAVKLFENENEKEYEEENNTNVS